MRLVAAAAVAVVALAASPARGDGGPPFTLRIAFHRGDAQSLFVMTNYGPMLTHDGGCTFRWLCEANVGYGGDYIPKIAVADDGTLLATTFKGLRTSRDDGCVFETATAQTALDDPGRIADISVEGLAVGPTGEVWVGTNETGKTNDVYVSRDHARTFEPMGLASNAIRWHSIGIAPSDPARVYVAGVESPGIAYLRRRTGDTWFESPLTGVAFGSAGIITIEAVDPVDPEIVYIASERPVPNGDRLYRSTDGGATFTPVLTITGFLRDVVARGNEVIVTTQVTEGPRVVGGPAFVSTDRGLTFGPLAGAPRLSCLGTAPDGALVGCGANWQPDYMAVARFDGQAWTKVWRFVELAGPQLCAPGTGGHEVCDRMWSNIDIELMSEGPSCGPYAPDAGVSNKPPPDDTCCSASPRPMSLVWAAGVVWLLRRRRRR